MERNVPATTEEQAVEHERDAEVVEHERDAEAAENERPAYRQDVSVAFLPLALITFLTLAFAAAAWTILAAG